PSDLAAPLVGRAATLRHLVGSFQQARGGQPQAVLVVGEAGIGKTRLATELVGWARAQGAEVLSGHALELGERLPDQPLLEDLHWVDGASLDLLRYLGHSWKEHSSRVLLLGTVRSEGLEPNPQLSAQLADLGRDLPLSQVSLQPLSKPETIHLVQAIVG